MGILLILICIWLIGCVVMLVQRIKAKTTASKRGKSDPKAAVSTLRDALDDSAISQKEFVKEIEKIIDQTGSVDAMQELVNFYTSDSKDDEKRTYWETKIVRTGDLKAIVEFYGFTDYDVSSDNYADMIQDLNTARTVTSDDSQRALGDYLCGLVNYKMGRSEVARKFFASITDPQLTDSSCYMTFQCFILEGNIPEAEKVLEKLEGRKFELHAADYLVLYNAYVTMRNNGHPNYYAEATYADRYAACKDADAKTANRIGGDAYYRIAVGFEKGTNGFPKKPDESLNAYEKAAQYENADALYYMGEALWRGKLPRNYSLANQYLTKAAQMGNPQAQAILQQYGVDGILIRLKEPEVRTYQFLDGHKLTVTKNTASWLQLSQGIYYKASLVASTFSSRYSASFQTFDQLMNGVHQLYADHIAQMIKWSLMLLMAFGIDTYDASTIMQECGDLSLLPRVPNFEQGLERIDARARKLNIKLSYAQATRGTWQGAGFGTTVSSTISSAAKASLAAGVMNIGSGILHGIGDSIVESMNNSEINGMGKALFESPGTKKEFVSAVLSACITVGGVVIAFIERDSGLRLEPTGSGISYGGENLAHIDDRTLNAKISNNLTAGNNKYAYALLVEHLSRFPFNSETLKQIMALTVHLTDSSEGEEYDSLYRYIGDFNISIKF